MPGADYGTQRMYIDRVSKDADTRKLAVERAIREAFSLFIERREVEVVVFATMSAIDLAEAISSKPVLLKPLLACCNLAARAVERDLGIRNLDTYSPSLTEDQTKIIAGYLKPFLPNFIELPTLSQIDRISFIDKEIRKIKGQWELRIRHALNRHSPTPFHKRTFEATGEEFEIDAATPERGAIKIGIDVKRIEARRDIHKRCDEIVNKSTKFKSIFRNARFGAVIYYPFIDEQINVQNRLRSPNIDAVVFASDSDESIENAVRMILSTLEASA